MARPSRRGAGVEPQPAGWPVTALGVAVAVAALAAAWSLRRCRVQQRDPENEPATQDAGLRAMERWVLTRELHDVVTHHLSTAVLQVMSDFDEAGPDELRSTLTKVDRSVHAALAELRQATRVQRDDPVGRQVAGPDRSELSAPVPPTTAGALWARRLTDAG